MYNSSLGRNITEQKTLRAAGVNNREEVPAKPVKKSQQSVLLSNSSSTQVNPTTCSSATKIRIAATEISDGPEISRDVCDKVYSCACEKEWKSQPVDYDGSINTACVRECDCQSEGDTGDLCDGTGDLCDGTVELSDNNMNRRHVEKAGLKPKCKKVNIAPLEQVENQILIETPDFSGVINVDSRSHFITHVGPRRFSTRTKTSVSRRSTVTQKTSKSCPPTMELDLTTSKHVNHKAVPTLRAKSAYSSKPQTFRSSKLFSRMSQEAQHAMTETIQEHEGLRMPNNNFKTQQWIDENFAHQNDVIRSRVQENVYVKQPPPSGDRGPGHRVADEDVYETNYNIEDVLPNDSCTDSEMSVNSRRRPITSDSTNMRLPSIPSDSTADYCTLGQLKHFNLRLPGIGRYEIATLREKTFEITPPGYDIRYNDVVVFEEGERENELPSEDIRERAVQKCQDWLARYSPRKEISN